MHEAPDELKILDIENGIDNAPKTNKGGQLTSKQISD